MAAAPFPGRSKAFVDVPRAAGLEARRRGVWDMFNPDFAQGYLGVGQAWGDYDNDGWPDLFVSGNMAANALRRNVEGAFVRSPLADDMLTPGLLTGGVLWGDYDNDGWSDLYVLAHGSNRLFRKVQGRALEAATAAAGVGRGQRRQRRVGRLRQ